MLPKLSRDCDEVKVRNNLVRLWTNFAKYGHPTPANSIPVAWPVAVESRVPQSNDFSLNYLEIDSELQVKQNPGKQSHDFWRTLISKYQPDLLN